VATFQLPRVVIAGLSGSAGKTLVSVGLARALRRQGLEVAVFKKGPDFIDPAWLGVAAGSDAHNLDTFLTSTTEIVRSLQNQSRANIAIIEGNRGLFDGFDAQGTHSTAELAKHIQAPVILVVDATKTTRTVAALVLGCLALDPELPLAGIVLNRIGTARQERLIREVLALTTKVPVLGAIPRLAVDYLPARHLGLLLPAERQDCEQALDALGDVIAKHIDLMSLRHVADKAPELHVPDRAGDTSGQACPNGTITSAVELPSKTRDVSLKARSGARTGRRSQVRVGILRDAAFCFYYSENLAALKAEGATLVPISPLGDRELPAIDALYAGGGYPEEFAQRLSANIRLRGALAARIYEGLPVWAECGGLMYLASAIERDGTSYPMVGALPIVVEHTSQPQAHGYVEARVDKVNPYLPVGTCLRGHEFHHSRIVNQVAPIDTALLLERGMGVCNGRDGIVVGRVFATYTHFFAPGTPGWAPAFIRVAREVQSERESTTRKVEGEHHGKHSSRRPKHRSRRGWVHPGT
jgi:cobyrinic acid a,c-diamide synthase